MISPAEWSLRQQQWAEYRRWAASEPSPEVSGEDAMANVGTILTWIPASVRQEERDPEKRGVQRMHFLLGLLKPR